MPLFSKKNSKKSEEEKKITFKEAMIHDSKEDVNPLEENIDLKDEDFSKLEEDFSQENNTLDFEETKTELEEENTEEEKTLEETEEKKDFLEEELPELEEIPEQKVEDVNLNVKVKLPEENYEEEIKKALEEKKEIKETQKEIEEEQDEKPVIFIKNNNTFIELEDLQKVHYSTDIILKIEKKTEEKFESIRIKSEEENKLLEQLKKIIEQTNNNMTRIEKILYSKGE